MSLRLFDCKSALHLLYEMRVYWFGYVICKNIICSTVVQSFAFFFFIYTYIFFILFLCWYLLNSVLHTHDVPRCLEVRCTLTLGTYIRVGKNNGQKWCVQKRIQREQRAYNAENISQAQSQATRAAEPFYVVALKCSCVLALCRDKVDAHKRRRKKSAPNSFKAAYLIVQYARRNWYRGI